MTDYDYGEDAERPAEDQVALLGRLVDRLAAEEAAVEAAERQLKEAQERVRKLRENDIPELMHSVGMREVTTSTGLRVRLREEVRASLPKDPAKREAAFAWLRENGHEGMIKHEMNLKFTRNQNDEVAAVADALDHLGIPLNLTRKDDIHHQTLCAFLREQLRQGTGVPLPVFGAFVQKFAEVDHD